MSAPRSSSYPPQRHWTTGEFRVLLRPVLTKFLQNVCAGSVQAVHCLAHARLLSETLPAGHLDTFNSSIRHRYVRSYSLRSTKQGTLRLLVLESMEKYVALTSCFILPPDHWLTRHSSTDAQFQKHILQDSMDRIS